MNARVAVAGTGYVGLSLATLLSQYNSVTAVDILREKVDLINQRKAQFKTNTLRGSLLKKS